MLVYTPCIAIIACYVCGVQAGVALPTSDCVRACRLAWHYPPQTVCGRAGWRGITHLRLYAGVQVGALEVLREGTLAFAARAKRRGAWIPYNNADRQYTLFGLLYCITQIKSCFVVPPVKDPPRPCAGRCHPGAGWTLRWRWCPTWCMPSPCLRAHPGLS